MMKIKNVFSTGDVAKMLGVTIRTVQVYLRDGKIHASIKLPSGFQRFTEADIQAIRDKYFNEAE